MYDPTVPSPKTPDQLALPVLMYGCLSGLGAVGVLLFLLVVVWPQWRVNAVFIETEALVVDQREAGGEGGSFRQVQLRYPVSGVDVEHWTRPVTIEADSERAQQRIRALAVGDRCRVWYDPADPGDVVVNRGYRIPLMLAPFIVVPGFFLLYGAGKLAVGFRRFAAQRPGSLGNVG